MRYWALVGAIIALTLVLGSFVAPTRAESPLGKWHRATALVTDKRTETIKGGVQELLDLELKDVYGGTLHAELRVSPAFYDATPRRSTLEVRYAEPAMYAGRVLVPVAIEDGARPPLLKGPRYENAMRAGLVLLAGLLLYLWHTRPRRGAIDEGDAVHGGFAGYAKAVVMSAVLWAVLAYVFAGTSKSLDDVVKHGVPISGMVADKDIRPHGGGSVPWLYVSFSANGRRYTGDMAVALDVYKRTAIGTPVKGHALLEETDRSDASVALAGVEPLPHDWFDTLFLSGVFGLIPLVCYVAYRVNVARLR